MELGIDRIVDLLAEMGIGAGGVAFLCRLTTLPYRPELEQTTDGFMICFGPFAGVHVFMSYGYIYCTQVFGDDVATHQVEDQLVANELFCFLMEDLLAA